MFGLCSEDIEDMPVVLKDICVEETDAAIADAHGVGSPLVDVFAMEEIVLKFLLVDGLRCLLVELTEHTHSASVCLLCALAFTVEL